METMLDILVIIAVAGHLGTGMEVRQTYRSGRKAEKTFENLVVNKHNGEVFLGALNKLMRFSSRLVLLETDATGPREDNPLCPPKIIGCKHEKSYMNAYSKGMVIDYDNNKLISCSSLYHGLCQRRPLNNLTKPHRDIYKTMVANDQSSSTVIFIAKGANPIMKSLYVASTFTDYGDIGYRNLVPALSSRRLDNFVYTYRDKDGGTLKKFVGKFRKDFPVTYVDGFYHNGFVYFVSVQKESLLGSRLVTKLIRVCAKDKYFNTYVETTLKCTYKEFTYNRAQGAVLDTSAPSNTSLYVAFINSMYTSYSSHTPTQSAVCAINMDEVEDHFSLVVDDCYQGIGKLGPPHIVGVPVPHCPDLSLPPDTCGQSPNASRYPAMMSSSPLTLKPLLQSQRATITAITMATVNGSPVMFLGTAEGSVQKAVQKLDGNFTIAHAVEVNSGMAIKHDMMLSPDKQFLYVMTSSKITLLEVSRCTPHPDCGSCVQIPDPYCGWCVTDNRCSRKEDCKAAGITPSWLPASAQKCPTMSDPRPAALSLQAMQQTKNNKISFILENIKLPEGQSSHVECRFLSGSLDRLLPASVGNDDRVTCPVPPLEQFPKIQPGKDHVNVSLRLLLADRFVSKRTVSLYDCSVNTQCNSCTETQFLCKWCPVTHSCMDATSPSTCSADKQLVSAMVSRRENCSVMERPHVDIVVHSGDQKEIFVPLKNLQSFMADSHTLKCHFELPAGSKVVKASYTGGKVYCDMVKFTYADREKPYVMSDFKVTWGVNQFPIDNPDNVQVRIYKCPMLVTNCGKCLTMDPEYKCGWCSDSCTLNKHCPRDWLDRLGTCPDPQIIRFNPASGPVGGKTNISVTGINLGKVVRDIQGAVTVAGVRCVVEGDNYQASSGFVCETTGALETTEGHIKVMVNSRFETVSKGIFSFVKPKVTNITPTRGPVSGGTTLTIIGHYMDSGSLASVKMGDNFCKLIMRNSTAIRCLTQGQKSYGPVKMLVSFGGSEQPAPVMFTYVPDPTIISVEPTITIPSGGTTLAVVGTNFDVINNIQFFLYIHARKVNAPCTRKSGTLLKCFTPPLPHHLVHNITLKNPREVHYGFTMDRVQHLDHISEQTHFGPLLYYPDPDVHKFEENHLTYFYEHDLLTINGNLGHLNAVRGDVQVYVGQSRCHNVTIYRDALTCLPPSHPHGVDHEGNAHIVVRVGNHKTDVGYLNYHRKASASDKPIALGVILGVVLPILVIVTLLTICVVRRHMKQGTGDELYRDDGTKEQEILLNNVKVDYNSKEAVDYVNGLIAGLQDSHLEQSAREIIIDRNQLDIGPVFLGKGFYGTVYRAELQTSADTEVVVVAVKILHGRVNGNSNLHLFMKEAIAVKDFTHTNILSLLGVSFAPSQMPIIVMPYMPSCDLHSYIKDSNRKLKVHELITMGGGICAGMCYLSDLRFVHRNLAARNCMVCEDNSIKVSDYGLTKDLFSDDFLKDCSSNNSPLKWRAPESLDRFEFSSQSDVWSFGVVMWELMTRGVTPYPNIQTSQLSTHLNSGQRLNKPKSCPQVIFELMMTCWVMSPPDRPDFHSLSASLHTLTSSVSHDSATSQTQPLYANIECSTSTEFLDMVV